MDGRKKSGSSLTSDLFGSKDSGVAASSSGIFGTIFAPPAKAVGGNDSLLTPEKEKKHDPGSQSWNSKTAVSAENNDVKGEGKDSMLYPVENVHPCNYSSSIYYGGQDIYSPPQATTAQSTVFTTFNKDGGEDDSNGASRGNWWQGMLSIVVKSMYSGWVRETLNIYNASSLHLPRTRGEEAACIQ